MGSVLGGAQSIPTQQATVQQQTIDQNVSQSLQQQQQQAQQVWNQLAQQSAAQQQQTQQQTTTANGLAQAMGNLIYGAGSSVAMPAGSASQYPLMQTAPLTGPQLEMIEAMHQAGMLGSSMIPTGVNWMGQGQNILSQAPGYIQNGANVLSQAPNFLNQASGLIGQSTGLINQARPFVDEAGNMIRSAYQPITSADINSFYNPFASSVMANLQDVFGQQNLANRVGASAASGGVGGDRAAVAQALLAKQQGLTTGQVFADIYQRALAAEQQQKQQQLASGIGMGNLGSIYGNLAGTMGGLAGTMGGLGATMGSIGSAWGGLGGQMAGIGSAMGNLGLSDIQAGSGLLGQGMQAASLPWQVQQLANQAAYQQALGQYQDPFLRAQSLGGLLPALIGLGQTGSQTGAGTTLQAGQQAGTQTGLTAADVMSNLIGQQSTFANSGGQGLSTQTFPAPSLFSQLAGLGTFGLGLGGLATGASRLGGLGKGSGGRVVLPRKFGGRTFQEGGSTDDSDVVDLGPNDYTVNAADYSPSPSDGSSETDISQSEDQPQQDSPSTTEIRQELDKQKSIAQKQAQYQQLARNEVNRRKIAKAFEAFGKQQQQPRPKTAPIQWPKQLTPPSMSTPLGKLGQQSIQQQRSQQQQQMQGWQDMMGQGQARGGGIPHRDEGGGVDWAAMGFGSQEDYQTTSNYAGSLGYDPTLQDVDPATRAQLASQALGLAPAPTAAPSAPAPADTDISALLQAAWNAGLQNNTSPAASREAWASVLVGAEPGSSPERFQALQDAIGRGPINPNPTGTTTAGGTAAGAAPAVGAAPPFDASGINWQAMGFGSVEDFQRASALAAQHGLDPTLQSLSPDLISRISFTANRDEINAARAGQAQAIQNLPGAPAPVPAPTPTSGTPGTSSVGNLLGLIGGGGSGGNPLTSTISGGGGPTIPGLTGFLGGSSPYAPPVWMRSPFTQSDVPSLRDQGQAIQFPSVTPFGNTFGNFFNPPPPPQPPSSTSLTMGPSLGNAFQTSSFFNPLASSDPLVNPFANAPQAVNLTAQQEGGRVMREVGREADEYRPGLSREARDTVMQWGRPVGRIRAGDRGYQTPEGKPIRSQWPQGDEAPGVYRKGGFVRGYDDGGEVVDPSEAPDLSWLENLDSQLADKKVPLPPIKPVIDDKTVDDPYDFEGAEPPGLPELQPDENAIPLPPGIGPAGGDPRPGAAQLRAKLSALQQQGDDEDAAGFGARGRGRGRGLGLGPAAGPTTGGGANPYMALMQAGLGMMAAAGKRDSHGLPMSPLAAIATGGMHGIEGYQTAQQNALKEKTANETLALRRAAQQSLEQHRLELEKAAARRTRMLEALPREIGRDKYDIPVRGMWNAEKGTWEPLPGQRPIIAGRDAATATPQPAADAEVAQEETVKEAAEQGAIERYADQLVQQGAKPKDAIRIATQRFSRTLTIPPSSMKEIRTRANAYQQLEGLDKSFEKDFAGKTIPAVGGIQNWIARQTGIGNVKAANWWQDYQAYVNQVRHGLFGAALTGFEIQQWSKQDINPGMTEEAIKHNLKRQTDIVKGAMKREANTLIEQGYSKPAIEKAMGIKLRDLPDPINPPKDGQEPPAAPATPSALPQPTEADREYVKNHPEKRGLFIKRFGIEP